MLFSKRIVIFILFLICELSVLTLGVSGYDGEQEVQEKFNSISLQMSAEEYYETLQYLSRHIGSFNDLGLLLAQLHTDRRICSMWNEDPQSIGGFEGVELPSCSDEYFFDMVDWLLVPAMNSFLGDDDMLMEMFPTLFDQINPANFPDIVPESPDIVPEPRPELCYDGDVAYLCF
jgi:hypothetical protein